MALRDSLRRLALLILGVIGTYVITSTMTARLSTPTGFHLVAVQSPSPTEHIPRPHRLWFILLDGLSQSSARTFTSMQFLRAHGWCAVTHMGPVTLSRSIYSVLSSGLEADRTGVRSNDPVGQLAVDSVWDAAREAGVHTVAVSELTWWWDLFPRGFDERVQIGSGVNVFDHVTRIETPTSSESLWDPALILLHALEADNAGHRAGGDSMDYTATAGLLDEHLRQALATFDLRTDTVIVTADHGHTARGGHGGLTSEVADVLTCAAGAGIRVLNRDVEPLEAHTIAPLVSWLLDVRFPRHMRAVEDQLDRLAQLSDLGDQHRAWFAERTDGIALHRKASLETLARDGLSVGWTSAATKSNRYRTGIYFVTVMALALSLGAMGLWRRFDRTVLKHGLAVWSIGTLLFCGLYRLFRGGFDLSTINKRESFIQLCVWLGVVVVLVLVVALRLVMRNPTARAHAMFISAAMSLAVVVAHPMVFGWKIGWPVPTAFFVFLPFIAGLWCLACSAGWLVSECEAWMRRREEVDRVTT